MPDSKQWYFLMAELLDLLEKGRFESTLAVGGSMFSQMVFIIAPLSPMTAQVELQAVVQSLKECFTTRSYEL